MNYTKGEWKYYYDGMKGITAVCAEDGIDLFTNEVAKIQGDTQEEKDANAYLIAAAPEMYEALERLMVALEECGSVHNDVRVAYNLAKPALAKAKGV